MAYTVAELKAVCDFLQVGQEGEEAGSVGDDRCAYPEVEEGEVKVSQ